MNRREIGRIRALYYGKVNRYSTEDLWRLATQIFKRENTKGMGTRKLQAELMSGLGFPNEAGDFNDAHYEAIDYFKEKFKDLHSEGYVDIQFRHAPFQATLAKKDGIVC